MAETVKDIQKKEAETVEGVERTKAARVYTPAVDIVERKEDIVVLADVPGADEKSVDITLEKNILTICGRVEEEKYENIRLNVAEYGIGDYERTFTLSDEINRDRIKATVKNGVLKVVLPKADIVKTKKISVSIE